MWISALPTGTYNTPAMLAYRGGSMGDTRHFAATAVLVHHPQGNILIDAGFGRRVEQQMTLLPSIQRAPHHIGTPVVDQLASASAPVHEISAILPTHPHWDHISGIADFPGVPVLINPNGKRFITAKAEGTEVLNSISNINFHEYKFDSGPFFGFLQSHDVFGDGSVVVIPVGGHTPDSVAIFVGLPSGRRFVFIGDLVWQLDGIDIPAVKPWLMRWLIGENEGEVKEGIARIRTISSVDPRIRVVPAHDARAFSSIATFPNTTR
jgi:glyoxylase-like metal-dependent hydrolase (beta-lactamase superfamily II)